MSELQDQILDALNKNVNLSEQEYKEKVIKADASTEAHGVEGKAPVSEKTRHKRIQSNFYGISLNFLSCLLNAMEQQQILIAQQNAMLFAICEKENIDVNKYIRRTDE